MAIRRPPVRAVLLCSALLFSASCGPAAGEAEGLRSRRSTGGPGVVVDFEARPFPEIPFPNDLATAPDQGCPTGRSLNVSTLGGTDEETDVRRRINDACGFGLLQPITVQFDDALDVRRLAERHHEPTPDFSDDAVYLVNVDPDSPGFGRLRLLDMGRGNYPVTHKESSNFFANDPRSAGTNLLFETVREPDVNGNGVLDPTEDTDGDGVRDVPNTLDPGADPLAPGQLMTFYERETDTLIARPVRPLRQETTYAVVLTSALRGRDGAEVHSPYPSIKHVRQNDALRPLRDILPERFPDRFTSSLDGVQFAWSFTTGRPTRTLEAMRAGLYGHGSFSRLADRYKPKLELVHDVNGQEDDSPMVFELPQGLINQLIPLVGDQVGSKAAQTIKDELDQIDHFVSGSFVSPYLLSDDDGLAGENAAATIDGTNPQVTDEHFRIDPATGRGNIEPGEVTFTCTIPKEGPGRSEPFPVVVYSHAISSTRFELILVAGAFARLGLATCAIDAAGHGIEIPSEFKGALDSILEGFGVPNLGKVIQHDRARDIRNDGTPDPGEDYFSSDLLHSRSMMQQTAIDQMQFVRIMRSWSGEKRWPSKPRDSRWTEAHSGIVASWDHDGDGRGELRGDFDGDGTVDFGGNRSYAAFGTSLGAIQTGILAAIEPTVTAAATNAGGGGLSDIAARTTIGHVRSAVTLRMMGPLLIGEPAGDSDGDDESEMKLSWVLPTGIDTVRVPFARTEAAEPGDRVVLRNLAREQRPHVPVEDRAGRARVRKGGFRVSVAADAKSGSARRAKLGFDPSVDVEKDLLGCVEASSCGGESCPDKHYCAPDDTCQPLDRCVPEAQLEALRKGEKGRAIARRTVKHPARFGDRLVVEIRGPDGTLEERIDTFERNTTYQNILYPAGSTLAALDWGWGMQRQTPRFRRFLGISQMLLAPADPANWAPHYFLRPLEFPYEQPRFRQTTTNTLLVGTIGDQTVPINTGLTQARAAGLLETRRASPRYGKPANQFLVDRFVYEGLPSLSRFPSHPGTLFDADDLDRGTFRSDANPDEPDPNPDADSPLRATVSTSTGSSGLRLPYLNTAGTHTFNAPRPGAPFDIPSFMTNQVGWFLATEGAALSDHPCLQTMPLDHCPFFEADEYDGPALGNGE
ncbi:MAG: hypothetical protein ABEL76_17650 [Bradymonadaceae bacterium]